MTPELTVDAKDPARTTIAEIAGAIGRGQVVVCPTETLYALVADAANPSAVERVYAIKNRGSDQPLPLMAADVAQVEVAVGPMGGVGVSLAAEFWPGPLTLVVQARGSIDSRCLAADGSVAVRVPGHVVARAIARAVGGPVTSTSANRSGVDGVARVSDLDVEIRGMVGLIVNAGTLTGGAPSTIVDVRGRVPKLVRDGAVAWSRVLRSLA
ncbi:MAG: L-threonylcarbamoyladenylate synthase [Vicinamibacterales bacterium]|jgi:L-threonylcarbamoyladenylate synthase|nr:threonylcarbamoyl-AMP synthase [Acidobacteriota bacterium]MDP7295197.1 L-threonylcarbamoyladenylate synthase [Vicinamibacterales bacterium]MDP7470997.1 L-threonylcarbamoyladenylate synthase [Vicinamibacterales bacterium]MDP7672529.1 L-threonylcarbamoyladenylate synthase [Vicinamibacterales bacterium]HJO37133.1 L-threonylcarbamoyladenylate synthase [Vicinamibacterales bacterium]|tara:strand:+ start:1943 stop:2575 length:633 start_codon:yes stop_codon:yes gene_type:complete